MSKVHGKRYAYKFDFQGLSAAQQQQQSHTLPAAPTDYRVQPELFLATAPQVYPGSRKVSAMDFSSGECNVSENRHPNETVARVLQHVLGRSDGIRPSGPADVEISSRWLLEQFRQSLSAVQEFRSHALFMRNVKAPHIVTD